MNEKQELKDLYYSSRDDAIVCFQNKIERSAQR